MILKGSQRAGAGQLAEHLLNERDNEHVELYELRGFMADDLRGAFAESQAIANGTKCRQHIFSLSLNPPIGAKARTEDFERAADAAEKALGLDGQPRAIVFHEKEGRRHAHVVWSRIDAEHMRAVNLPFFKRKLTALSRELYLEHGWTLPVGLRSDGGRSWQNFTLAEWQQAKRLGRDPREIKATIRDAWERSDTLQALNAALVERGYFMARGDRRGVVLIDLDGEIYALAKYAGVKTKDIREKIGDGGDLPGVEAVRSDIRTRVTVQMRNFINQVKTKHRSEMDPLRGQASTMAARHADERQRLSSRLEERWMRETQDRASRFRSGLVGIWDRVTGKAETLRAQNEREALEGLRRDRAHRDDLIQAQIADRRPVQSRIDALRRRQVQERKLLAREIAQALRRPKREVVPERTNPTARHQKRGFSLDR